MRSIAMVFGTFFLVFIVLVPKQNSVAAARNYEEPEAYRVYSSIFPKEWAWQEARANTLVIRVETVPYTMCIEPDKESEKIIGNAIADYKAVNQHKWLLQRQFDIEKPYELISGEEIDITFKSGGRDGWEAFYERHPDSGGWMELSAVGFNTSKTIAVVYAGHHCGWLCGGGTFHVLRKTNGRWLPLQLKGGSFCSWAS